MALAEALKSNTTLKRLWSAALPSILPANCILLAPTACTFAALAPTHPSFCRVRRLSLNELGPEAGMAFAEALKSNTTLEYLESAALPLNPPVHALWLHPYCPRGGWRDVRAPSRLHLPLAG